MSKKADEKISGTEIKTAGNKSNVQKPKPVPEPKKEIVVTPQPKVVVKSDLIELSYTPEGRAERADLMRKTINEALNGTDVRAKLRALEMAQTYKNILR